jgi:hypothetical protein
MMRKFFDHKVWILLLGGMVVLILVMLASGLGDLRFSPGRALPQERTTPFQISIERIAGEIASIPIWKLVVFWGLVLVLVLIVASLFPPAWRKKLLRYFLRYAVFVLVLFYVVKNFHLYLPGLSLGNLAGVDKSSPGTGQAAPAAFTTPQVSPLLLFGISLGVILAIGLIAFLIGRTWQRKRRTGPAALELGGFAEIARVSLADISSGRKWEDAIINCYARMNEVVSNQRGVLRGKDLTASEFVTRLEAAGLPGDSVRRLTRLFEAARYGAGQASQAEISEAVACLTTVLHACGVNE